MLKWTLGDCTLICGDSLEVLPTLEAGSVDAVVTDPPFFMPAAHYQSRVEYGRAWSDTSILTHWWGMVCDALRHPLRQEGHCAVFCNSDSYAAFYPAMFTRWAKLKCLVWDKGHVGLGRIFRNQHELIIWARDTGHYVPEDGVLRADVFRFKATPSSTRDHPVEKPSEMLAWIVEPMTPPGGTVCDPFAGSGTTGVACIRTGRRFIGIEKEPKYFEIAKRRITEAYEAQALLAGAPE